MRWEKIVLWSVLVTLSALRPVLVTPGALLFANVGKMVLMHFFVVGLALAVLFFRLI